MPIHNMIVIGALSEKIKDVQNREEEILNEWPENHIIDKHAYIEAINDLDNILNESLIARPGN